MLDTLKRSPNLEDLMRSLEPSSEESDLDGILQELGFRPGNLAEQPPRQPAKQPTDPEYGLPPPVFAQAWPPVMPRQAAAPAQSFPHRAPAQNALPAKPTKPTGARRAVQIGSGALFWVMCVVLVVGSILFATSNNPQKSYFNYRTYNVLTQSMTPRADGTSPPGGFRAGDVILVQMCKAEAIKVGDIITFNPNPNDATATSYLTHRVVEVLDELGGKPGVYFVTRGDANNSDDPPISGDMLIGKKVAAIPHVGGFLQKVREHFAVASITVVCFFAFIIMARWYFAKPKELQTRAYPYPAPIMV